MARLVKKLICRIKGHDYPRQLWEEAIFYSKRVCRRCGHTDIYDISENLIPNKWVKELLGTLS